MKLGLFTDAHYSSVSGPAVLERIEKAFKAFQRENCDLVVFLGDLLHDDVSHEAEIGNLKAISGILGRFPGKVSVIIGNHDTNLFTKAEFSGSSASSTAPKQWRSAEYFSCSSTAAIFKAVRNTVRGTPAAWIHGIPIRNS